MIKAVRWLGVLAVAGVLCVGSRAQFGLMPLVGQKAPELPPAGENVSGTTWINSGPLTLAQLRGKVVMIDFWEYTCINCIRTFPENKRWYARYHPSGFEIIGVHDPEFDIAYPVARVSAAVKRLGLPYPVVVDDWFRIWKSYFNNTWPNRFLIDARGIIRYNIPGEGHDAAFEHEIVQLLKKAQPGLTLPAGDTIPAERDRFAPSCGVPTEEMYVGNWYGRGVLANREGYHDGQIVEYALSKKIHDGRAAVAGRWLSDKNAMIYAGPAAAAPQPGSEFVMAYHARELYSVLNVARGRPSRLYIRQDGSDLTQSNKGVDVQFDAGGHSFINVDEPRMYYLVQNPEFGKHTVELLPTAPGLAVNSFTFGNNCQTDFPHL